MIALLAQDASPEAGDAATKQAGEQAGDAAANGAGGLPSSDEVAGFFSPENIQSLVETYLVPALGFLLLLLVAYIIGKWLGKMTANACRRSKIEETLAKFFGKLVFYIVFLAAATAGLGYLGINVAPFAAILAAAGFAIGLAFQGTLGNFSSGVMLLIFRPFKVGDVISAAGVTAKVHEIELFTTTLDTPDNRRMIVPNGAIFGSTIENITFHSTRRVDVSVGCDYSADLDKTREVLMSAAKSIDNVLPDPEPAIVLSELGGSSVDWVVRVWVNAADFWAVKDALTREVKIKLDEAGIGIPFPQMDVHLDKE